MGRHRKCVVGIVLRGNLVVLLALDFHALESGLKRNCCFEISFGNSGVVAKLKTGRKACETLALCGWAEVDRNPQELVNYASVLWSL